MKYIGSIYDQSLNAKDDIKKGNCVQRLWKKYCRLAKSNDTKIGIALTNAKKGQSVKVHWPRTDEIYEEDIY